MCYELGASKREPTPLIAPGKKPKRKLVFAMRRREFIGLLGGAVATWPVPLHAQQSRKNYRLAIVGFGGSPDQWTMEGPPWWRTFFEELRRRGYEEGRNLVVDRLAVEGHPERDAQVARHAVDGNPDVILVAYA